MATTSHDECYICLDEMTNPAMGPCNDHPCCLRCLQTALRDKRECPLCRTPALPRWKPSVSTSYRSLLAQLKPKAKKAAVAAAGGAGGAGGTSPRRETRASVAASTPSPPRPPPAEAPPGSTSTTAPPLPVPRVRVAHCYRHPTPVPMKELVSQTAKNPNRKFWCCHDCGGFVRWSEEVADEYGVVW